MSETQPNSCNNVNGDAVEVRDSTQGTTTEISQQTSKDPAQSATFETAQVAGGDNELKKVITLILIIY